MRALKRCHVCGSFDHLKNDCKNWYNNRRSAKPVWTNVQRVNKQNFSKLTYPSPKKNMVPKQFHIGPMKNIINNAYSTARRPFNKITSANNSKSSTKSDPVKEQWLMTASQKQIYVVKRNKGLLLRRLKTCGFEDQSTKAIHTRFEEKRSDNMMLYRHRTGNRSYLTYYEEIDGGFVAFGGNSKGGKITVKGKIRTGKLDFEDLTDESHVLLKVPRKDNMYSVDLKNVVPQGGLTCLFAKATLDESKLWHRRLGHINFKTINKLVKGNLKNPKSSSSTGRILSWIKAMQKALTIASYKNFNLGGSLPNGKELLGLNGFSRTRRMIEALIEAIRLFLAYASFKDFMVYQMDLKSAFLYGKIEEEVYVCQPPGFEDPDSLTKEDGIFISQDKYVNEILNKFGFSDVKTASTPMETHKTLLKKGEDIDEHLYRSKIGSLMYLTSSRPEIMFAVQIVVANSTTEAEYIAASNCCGQVLWIQNQLLDYEYNFMQTKIHIDNEKIPMKKLIQMIKIHTDQNVADLLTKAFDVSRFQYLIATLVDKKKIVITESTIRRDLHLEDAEGTDCLPTATIIEELIRMSGEPIENEAANEEHVPTHSNDPLLSGEDRLKLNELMELCTNLSQRVLNLEKTKTSVTSQTAESTKLKERVKKLEKRNKSRTPGLKRLRKGRKIADINKVEEVTLIDETHGRNDDNLMFDTNVLDEQEVEVEKTLIEIKATKPKAVTTAATTTKTAVTRPEARGVVVQEPSEFTTTKSQPSQLPHAIDKGTSKMVEPEKPLKKKDQIFINEEIAQRLQEELQAELEEVERLARQKEEDANIAE
ncbi:copia protein [Tanacetum coccineum]